MASQELHYNQYKSNKELLKTDVFKLEDSQYLDWIIIIAFYGALHLVEKKLHEIGSKHSKNHYDRNINILTTKELLPIKSEYYTLYVQSKRARYDCCSFTRKDVFKVLELFKYIEQTVS